jgi:hypothetical protein
LKAYDCPLDHFDSARVERRLLALCYGVVVREEEDVVRPLPQEMRMVDGTGSGSEDSDWLIANLPAVAVGAVEEVAAPALARPRDVRRHIAGACCEEQPARGQ